MYDSKEATPTGWRATLAKSMLTISLITLISARSVDRALFTRLTYALPDYLWYLANIILPIAFLVISWPVVWYKFYFTDDITPAMRKFPMYKFAIMGFFDTSSNLLSTIPQNKIGGDLSNVLSQTVLPMNMILSILFLGTRYKKVHVIGAILVIYGACVNLIPFFQGHNPNPNTHPTVGYIALSIFSMLPAASSNVYKEIALKDEDLDIWYANAWIGMFQLGWGLLTTWTIRIPAFTNGSPVPWDKVPQYIANANNCFLGYDNVVNVNTGAPVNCKEHAFLLFVIFIVFNITYNQLMLYVFKNGSSVLFVVASAVGLPLVDILYIWRWLAGPAYEEFSLYDGFALFVLVMAIVTYYSEKEERVTADNSATEPATPQFMSPRTERGHHNSGLLAPPDGSGSFAYAQDDMEVGASGSLKQSLLDNVVAGQ